MFEIITTKGFEKDLKRCMKRGLPMKKLFDAIELLRVNGNLGLKPENGVLEY